MYESFKGSFNDSPQIHIMFLFQFIEPLIDAFLGLNYLHKVRSSNSPNSQLIFDNIFTSVYFLIDPPKLHLDVVVFTKAAVHILACYRIDQLQQTVSFVFIYLVIQ